MPARINRSDFVNALKTAELDVRTAQADARLKGVLPARADLDGDGKISKEAELDRLFTQIDSFGRTPESQSVALISPDGMGTQAANAMRALGELTRNQDVMGWTAGIELKQLDFTQMVAPPGSFANADAMVGAASLLLRERKDNYGTDQPWFNLDPNHALPAGVNLGGLAKNDRNPNGVWKCNLFGGNALYAAGFEPPRYGNRPTGEYPNANQFFKWSDAHAAQYGNKVHFKMVGEVNIQGLSEDEKRTQLIAALRNAQPGDLIMVDHMGDGIADGGHTRVVMGNGLQADGSGEIHSAQATATEAAVRGEGLSSFLGEEKLWVLRPNKRREGPPVPGVAAAGQPPKPPSAGTYTVKPGDTLGKIAQAALGSSARWRELMAANPALTDPNKIRPGMTLNLPA
jgi:LysM repeat protein